MRKLNNAFLTPLFYATKLRLGQLSRKNEVVQVIRYGLIATNEMSNHEPGNLKRKKNGPISHSNSPSQSSRNPLFSVGRRRPDIREIVGTNAYGIFFEDEFKSVVEKNKIKDVQPLTTKSNK
jgi:hypothetical protein